MDPTFTGLPDYMNGFNLDSQPILPYSDQFSNLTNEYQSNQLSPDLSFMDNQFSLPFDPEPGHLVPSTSMSSDGHSFGLSASLSPAGGPFSLPLTVSPGGDSSSDDTEFSESVFKYVNQILMEDNIEKKPCMFFDPLGLQDTEKSFYDVLGEKYPFSPNQPPLYIDQTVENPDGNCSGNGSDCSGSNTASPGSSNPIEPQWLHDLGEQNPSFSQASLPSDYTIQYNSHPNSQLSVPLANDLNSVGGGLHGGDELQGFSVNEFLAQNIYTDSESILQFQRGLEEASKFLPKNNHLIIDLESKTVAPEVKRRAPKVIVKKEKIERKKSPNGSKGRKNHEREDVEAEEQRSSKQSAVSKEETELSEMFDRVLLYSGGPNESCDNVSGKNEASKTLQPNGQPLGSNGNGGKTRAKKQEKKKETVDLRNLLILCAQAVSTNDFRTTIELLKQVRQHSSPYGDGSQRLAHFFANGLEARMAGTGTGTSIFYTSLASQKISVVDCLTAYQVNFSACPFKRMSIGYMNKMIMKMSEKATTLHIVDFGILYGFQWPILIQHLQKRRGGPPKLRITGIDIPQPGFRPAEWIEETGRRLAKYCQRFNVPFEYNAIASQNWESIKLEDLKTERNEFLAVNSMLRFKNLLDETAEVNCPRDSVLKLIRRMKPDVFVLTAINGSYNAPFFVTRFREALFHFSAMYDAFDVNIARDNPGRLMFEREFYGREAMNVIACEGLERVERPETYKQWQVRCNRAGLKSLPLDDDIVKMLNDKLKAWYHKDYVIDLDGDWMLQGWKGRIAYASCCWVPA